MIELRATGLIYRDPTLHAWHPTLALLPNGDLLAAYDLGKTIGALDYCTYLARSTDGGQSWSEPVAFFADPVAAPARRTVRISTLADGTLIGAGRRSYCHHPETSGWNPETYGVEQGDWFVLRSRDGTHWQGPQEIDPPLAGPYEVCHAFVETGDGRLLLPTGLLRTWEGDAPDGLKTLALVSGDQGQTWPEYIELFADPQGEVIYHEVSLVELEGGRLLAVAWPFQLGSRSDPDKGALRDSTRRQNVQRPWLDRNRRRDDQVATLRRRPGPVPDAPHRCGWPVGSACPDTRRRVGPPRRGSPVAGRGIADAWRERCGNRTGRTALWLSQPLAPARWRCASGLLVPRGPHSQHPLAAD